MKLTVHTFVSLDGVMQGPGGPGEDGFAKGGWVVPHIDEDFGRIVDDGWFAHARALLLGRTTYQMFAEHWSKVTDESTTTHALNQLPKYVVSTTLSDDDASWGDSTVVRGDVVAEVRALKDREAEGELQVHGSWQLVRTLHDAGLIDELRLMVFPVVIGEGKRLFEDGAVPATFRVISSETTSKGVVSLVLEPGPFRVGEVQLDDEGHEVLAEA